MTLMDKIRKLFGVRSPHLESIGFYSCYNCSRALLDFGGDDCVYCPDRRKFVGPDYTCHRFKRLVIKPLRSKRFSRGFRANMGVIDEWSGMDAEFLYKQAIYAAKCKKEKQNDQT